MEKHNRSNQMPSVTGTMLVTLTAQLLWMMNVSVTPKDCLSVRGPMTSTNVLASTSSTPMPPEKQGLCFLHGILIMCKMNSLTFAFHLYLHFIAIMLLHAACQTKNTDINMN